MSESFGVNTGENIVSAIVDNTVTKKKRKTKTAPVDKTAPKPAPVVVPTNTTSVDSTIDMPTKLPENYTDEEFKRLGWDDIDIHLNNKVPVGVFGIPFMKFSFKQIRLIGIHFKIPRARNSKKADTIAGIVVAYKNRETYAPYRLINILFSDNFAADFGSLGDVVDRQELDFGKAPNNQQFWEQVEFAFGDKHYFGCLHFSDDPLFVDSGIDPSIVVPHDWKKLRAIWKSVNSDYKEVYCKFTQSGNHAEENFDKYCKKLKHVHYLCQFVREQPQLHESIGAGLPKKLAYRLTHPFQWLP